MIKTLVKKQMAEIFKSYFYDAKKNKKRSVPATVMFFVMYAVIMVGILGGIFGYLCFSLCAPLLVVNMGWLYYSMLALIAVALGCFGSVFSTYTGLYLSKDNDLLLSMPIPIRSILVSRLASVYLMGLMYSAVVSVPAVIIYWINAGITALSVIGGIIYIIFISLIVLTLSCILGWAVARISLKLKNKSFVTVLVSILFIVLYYVVYFKAQQIISDIIQNAVVYGEKIKGSAYIIYAMGRMGEGDVLAILESIGVTAVLLALTYYILSSSFIKIATSSGNVTKTKYQKKHVKTKGLFGAVFGKEMSRFISSPNYMLNCGLGVVFLPVIGIGIIVKADSVLNMLNMMTDGINGGAYVLLCTAMIFAAAMNDSTAPSVSLEGKNIWLTQVLPVPTRMFLQAKLMVQLAISAIPVTFAAVCIAIVWNGTIAESLILILTPMVLSVLFACFGLTMALLFPNLSWTNEISPIKQSLSVFITLFGGWAYGIIWPVLFFLTKWPYGGVSFMLLAIGVSAFIALALYIWIMKKGEQIFKNL